MFQLHRLVSALSRYHNDCHAVLKEADVFPIEVDLSRSTFSYDKSQQFNDEEDEGDENDEDDEGAAGGGAGAGADDDDDDLLIGSINTEDSLLTH